MANDCEIVRPAHVPQPAAVGLPARAGSRSPWAGPGESSSPGRWVWCVTLSVCAHVLIALALWRMPAPVVSGGGGWGSGATVLRLDGFEPLSPQATGPASSPSQGDDPTARARELARLQEPPTPAPPRDQAPPTTPRVTIGTDDGSPEGGAMLGGAQAQPHSAPLSDVDQPALSLQPGAPGPLAPRRDGPTANDPSDGASPARPALLPNQPQTPASPAQPAPSGQAGQAQQATQAQPSGARAPDASAPSPTAPPAETSAETPAETPADPSAQSQPLTLERLLAINNVPAAEAPRLLERLREEGIEPLAPAAAAPSAPIDPAPQAPPPAPPAPPTPQTFVEALDELPLDPVKVETPAPLDAQAMPSATMPAANVPVGPAPSAPLAPRTSGQGQGPSAGAASAGGESALPGLRSSSEAQAFSRQFSLDFRPGQPLAAQGIRVQTVLPRFSITTRLTAIPRNPTVLITFRRGGSVASAVFEDGRGTGYDDVDGPLLAAVHRWRATGELFDRMVQQSPTGLIEVKVRYLLRDEPTPPANPASTVPPTAMPPGASPPTGGGVP